MSQAIGRAIEAEMAEDPRVLLLGEDVAAAGGVFKTSDGLFERFGPSRVRDTPISEMGFLGVAVGAAAMGYRPVVEIMFGEFLGVALDQLVTEAAKLRFLSGGQFTAPLVVRASVGPGLGFGAQHSQTLESWFTNTPGLKVVTASGADSAYRLIRAAIRDPDPVMVLEPRALYGEREEVDVDAAPKALDPAPRHIATGTEVTVATMGQMVSRCRAVAEEREGALDVFDLEVLSPLDVSPIVDSVRRTGRLVTVEANPYSGGWGGGVISEVVRHGVDALKAAPVRIAPPDVPVPYARALEDAYLPSSAVISERIGRLIADGQGG